MVHLWVGMGSRLSKNIKLAIVREENFFVAFLMNIVDTHTKSDNILLQLCHRLYIVDLLQGEAWAYGTFLPQLPVNVSWSVILPWLCGT